MGFTLKHGTSSSLPFFQNHLHKGGMGKPSLQSSSLIKMTCRRQCHTCPSWAPSHLCPVHQPQLTQDLATAAPFQLLPKSR